MDNNAIVVALISLAGTMFVAWRQYHRTSAQNDKDVLTNYAELIKQYRIQNEEQAKENKRLEAECREETEAHTIAVANYEAVLKKREIEYKAELEHQRKQTEAYQIGYAALRRVAVKYVPQDIPLPEVNGKTKDIK